MYNSSLRDAQGAKWFHVSTKGTDRCLFKSAADFLTGLNILATCSVTHSITLCAYCLMSNHIHLVGKTTYEVVLKSFISTFKQNYSRYFNRVYSEPRIFDRVQVSINEIKTVNYLKNTISYVMRNPVEAGICGNADQYPWSSYGCYFNMNNGSEHTTPLSSLSMRSVSRILKTDSDIRSGNLSITAYGNVVPESFIDAKYVESLFSNSRDELAKSIAFNSYQALEYELANPVKGSLPNYSLVKVASELARKRFGNELSVITFNERKQLALTLYSDYNASPYVICSVLGLTRKIVNQVLGLPTE